MSRLIHKPTGLESSLIVQITDLKFHWNERDPIVLDLRSLTVEPKRHLFIEGPSGCGKSTLLSLLAGVNVARTGSVQVLGQQLERLGSAQRDHFRADHIGYIFQMFNLIPYLTVIENVILPCRFSKPRRDKALTRSGSLENEAHRLLSHLDMAKPELLNRPVTNLSVGQQQRVAAARALMGSPELLIADEPTSALDNSRRETFVKLLFEECRETGSTLVFVSHDATLEPLFDQSINLDQVNRAALDANTSAQG